MGLFNCYLWLWNYIPSPQNWVLRDRDRNVLKMGGECMHSVTKLERQDSWWNMSAPATKLQETKSFGCERDYLRTKNIQQFSLKDIIGEIWGCPFKKLQEINICVNIWFWWKTFSGRHIAATKLSSLFEAKKHSFPAAILYRHAAHTFGQVFPHVSNHT